MQKITLTLGALCFLLAVQAQDNCNLKIGINLAGPTDYGSEWPFVNIFKYSRNWITHNHPDWTGGVPWDPWDTQLSDQIPTDEFGYPLQVPFQVAGADTAQVLRTVWANTSQLPSGVYVLLYDGVGSFDFWGDAQIISSTPGRLEVQVNGGPDASDGIMAMELEESQLGDHVRNIRFLLPGTEETHETEPWTEEWLEKLTPFKALRFMDWGQTNNSRLRHWEDRPQIEDFSYTLQGIPYEWMIEICNRQQADAWVCVPHLADEDYITQLATLFKEELDPDLTIYVEYSNEVWNWLFEQAVYCHDSLDQNLLWPERIGPKVAEVMEIWTDVFGPQTDRLVRVMAGQHGWYDVGHRIFQQIAAAGKADLIDAISPASYMSIDAPQLAQLGGNATPQDVISGAAAFTFDPNNWAMQGWYDHAQLALDQGKKLVYYEGGQHFTPDPWGTVQPYNQAMIAAQAAPEMYGLYEQLIDTLAELTEEETVMMHFSFIAPLWNDPNEGAYGNFGALSSQFFEQEPYSEAPKYRAIRDHINDCQQPVATENLPDAIDFEVFPNPARENVQVHWLNTALMVQRWQLLDYTGRVARSGVQLTAGQSIDLTDLPPGLYLLHLQTTKGACSRSLVYTP